MLVRRSVCWLPRGFTSCNPKVSGSNLFISSTRNYCEQKKSMIPDLKEIRQKTGAGIMECKRIYEENGMNKEKTIEIIMEKARSATGRSRNTTAGWLGLACSNNKGVVCELATETDFVANNATFRELTNKIAQSALRMKHGDSDQFTIDVEELSKEPCGDQRDVTIANKISELIFSMGETMKLERTEGLCVKEGIVDGYIHGGRIGVLVGLTGGNPTNELAKDLAVHIAACFPQYVALEDVPEGKEVKSSNVLLEQEYIHDESLTVKEVLKNHGSPKVVMHVLRR